MSGIAVDTVNLLKSKGVKASARPEPDYAKFRDQSTPFLHGVSFIYPNSDFFLKMYLGIYQCNTRLFAQVSIENHYPIPREIESAGTDFYTWLNAKNVRGCHIVAASNHLRFYLGSFLSEAAFCPALWVLIEAAARLCELTMREFVSWAGSDSAYRKMREQYAREVDAFASVRRVVCTSNVGWLVDAIDRTIHDLKVRKPSYIESLGICIYECKKETERPEENGLPQNLPIRISIGPAMFTVEMFVMQETKARKFSSPDECKYVQGLLAKANQRLKVGYFDFKEDKKQVILKVKCVYALVDRSQWRKCVKEAVMTCIESYTEMVPLMLKQLEQQLLVGSFSEDLSEEYVDFDKEDAAEGSYFSDSSDSSELSCNHSTLPSDRSPPIMSFDGATVADVSGVPAAARPYFVTSTGQLNRLKPVLWTRELQAENVCQRVKTAFENLAKVGVTFKTIPFDACGFAGDESRSVVLLPKFPQQDLVLGQSFDSSEFDSRITAEMTEYLLKALMNNPYTMENFSLYHSLDSPSLISLSQLKFQKLKHHCVGKGGFGQVYYNVMANCPVAVKLTIQKAHNKEWTEKRLKQELELQQACPHPSIVRAFGYIETEEGLGLVTEYCSGGTLKMYVQEKVLSIQQKVRLIREVAEGVVFMHGKNICHFDLKPTNVLMTEDGRAKICDFGMARQVRGDWDKKKTGLTMKYAAPEQIDHKGANKPADVWSFALIALHVLFTLCPFKIPDEGPDREKRTINAIKLGLQSLPITERFRNANPQLVALIQDCLKFDPHARPTALEVLEIVTAAEMSARD